MLCLVLTYYYVFKDYLFLGQCQNSNAGTDFAVNEGSANPILWSWLGHLSV